MQQFTGRLLTHRPHGDAHGQQWESVGIADNGQRLHLITISHVHIRQSTSPVEETRRWKWVRSCLQEYIYTFRLESRWMDGWREGRRDQGTERPGQRAALNWKDKSVALCREANRRREIVKISGIYILNINSDHSVERKLKMRRYASTPGSGIMSVVVPSRDVSWLSHPKTVLTCSS